MLIEVQAQGAPAREMMKMLFSRGELVRRVDTQVVYTVVRQHEDELTVDGPEGRVYADAAHFERVTAPVEATEDEAPFDVLDRIMEFEAGGLDVEETYELFQYLVDTGLAWQLQGFYGRTARDLIESGMVTAPE